MMGSINHSSRNIMKYKYKNYTHCIRLEKSHSLDGGIKKFYFVLMIFKRCLEWSIMSLWKICLYQDVKSVLHDLYQSNKYGSEISKR